MKKEHDFEIGDKVTTNPLSKNRAECWYKHESEIMTIKSVNDKEFYNVFENDVNWYYQHIILYKYKFDFELNDEDFEI